MTARTATIWGTGLIGASMGMALRNAGWRVSGWDPDESALVIAAERGAVDEALASPEGQDADLVVLAGPPTATIESLAQLTTASLVTDVAGVKAPIVKAAGHLPHFVGGHPMAGRANGGPTAATANLFRGAAWILTGGAEADVATMAGVVGELGARPIVMSAAEHDRAVAEISHLPHVVAASLVNIAATDPRALELAAGSFRDLTRVAASEPRWWAEILGANADEVGAAIEAFEKRLAAWRTAISEGRVDEIEDALRRAQETRQGMTADVARVQVPLFDQPGELGRVGRALERSGADIRDIQLRHGEHGGGGLLTLSVHARDAAALRAGLADEGFAPD